MSLPSIRLASVMARGPPEELGGKGTTSVHTTMTISVVDILYYIIPFMNESLMWTPQYVRTGEPL